MSSVSRWKMKTTFGAPQLLLSDTRWFLQFYKLEGSKTERRMWGLVFTTFIYWAEYKHGNNINWIHSQSLLDLFALSYGLVGKYQNMGNGAKLVEKPVPKLGKLKGTKISLRIKSFLERASEPVPRHTMDSRFCCHFFPLPNIDILFRLGA